MASINPFKKVKLTEDDVPGAKLSNTKLIENSKTELKRWLECRNMPVSGNKTTLIERSVSLFYSPCNANSTSMF